MDEKPGWRLCAIDNRFLVSGHATCPSFLQRHFPLFQVCLKNKNYFPVLFVFVCLFVVVLFVCWGFLGVFFFGGGGGLKK